MHTTLITLTGFLATNALAQGLDKPPLTDGLSFLQDGLLDHLHPVHSSHTKWGPGYIPIDCKTLTEQNNLSAADMEIYSVQYDDVGISVNCILSDPQSNHLASALTILGLCVVTKTALILSET